MKKEESFLPEKPLLQGKFFDPDTKKILSEFSEALKPDKPELPKELITQRSKYGGYFCSLVKIDDPVSKGQKIGFIKIAGLKKEEEIKAEVDGVIKEVLPNLKAGFSVTEKVAQYEEEERALTSVEYGQELFTIEKV